MVKCICMRAFDNSNVKVFVCLFLHWYYKTFVLTENFCHDNVNVKNCTKTWAEKWSYVCSYTQPDSVEMNSHRNCYLQSMQNGKLLECAYCFFFFLLYSFHLTFQSLIQVHTFGFGEEENGKKSAVKQFTFAFLWFTCLWKIIIWICSVWKSETCVVCDGLLCGAHVWMQQWNFKSTQSMQFLSFRYTTSQFSMLRNCTIRIEIRFIQTNVNGLACTLFRV